MKHSLKLSFFLYLCLGCFPVRASLFDITDKIIYVESGTYYYLNPSEAIPTYQAFLQLDTLELRGKNIVMYTRSSDMAVFLNGILLTKHSKGDSLTLAPLDYKEFHSNGHLYFSLYQPDNKPLGDTHIYLESVDTLLSDRMDKVENAYFSYRSTIVGVFWILILSIVAFIKADTQVFGESLLPQKFLTKSSIHEISGPRYRVSFYHILSWVAIIITTFVFFRISAQGSGQFSNLNYWNQTYSWLGIHLYMYLSASLLGLLFSNGSFSRFHVSQSIRVSASLSVILAFLTAVLYLSQTLDDQNFLKWQEYAIYFYALLRGTNILLSLNKTTSLFQLTIISYLCATEIIPLMVLVGIAN